MNRYRKMTLEGAIGIILIALLSRMMPHPPNFAPITGIALFSGVYFSNKRWSLLLPLICLFLTDIFIGFHSLVVVVYGSFLIISAASLWLKNINFITVFGASVFFFLTTNFGVWYLYYPHTWEGFTQCYVLAIPFFWNTLAGDLFYTAALFFAAEKLSSLNSHNLKGFFTFTPRGASH